MHPFLFFIGFAAILMAPVVASALVDSASSVKKKMSAGGSHARPELVEVRMREITRLDKKGQSAPGFAFNAPEERNVYRESVRTGTIDR